MPHRLPTRRGAVIEVEVDPAVLGRVRLVISPMWEAVSSLALLIRYGPEAPWPYTAWARRAHPALGEPTVARLAALITAYGSRSGETPPPFLVPVPDPAVDRFGDELARLAAVPVEVVRRELAALADDAPVDPAEALDTCVSGLASYWSATLDEYWPAMRTALDEDVLMRARVLATQGADALLAGLHARVDWDQKTLRLAGTGHRAHRVDHGALVLVPLLFARGTPLCAAATSSVAVGYPSRGAAVLAGVARPAPADPDPVDRLDLLLGRRRAAVLRSLATPSTTTSLANRLGIALSTVSEHLTALVSADVAQRRRTGGSVLYELTEAGGALLAALDGRAVA